MAEKAMIPCWGFFFSVFFFIKFLVQDEDPLPLLFNVIRDINLTFVPILLVPFLYFACQDDYHTTKHAKVACSSKEMFLVVNK